MHRLVGWLAAAAAAVVAVFAQIKVCMKASMFACNLNNLTFSVSFRINFYFSCVIMCARSHVSMCVVVFSSLF